MREWKRNKQNYAAFCQSEMWTTEAKAIKRERDFTCDGCGEMFPAWELDVHHRDYSHPNREGTPEKVPLGWFPERQYLEVLCRDCHLGEHGFGTWADIQRRLDQLGTRI